VVKFVWSISKSLWVYWRHESIAAMGVISRATDKLPTWVQVVLMVVSIFVSMYYIAHYGLFSFLMRMIFSPDI
jgi:hypothetical protein